MNKNEVLQQLRNAKAAHVKWVQRAKMLIEGFEMDKNAIPVIATECQFGTWFYSAGQKLNALRNIDADSMKKVESLHFKLHDIYMQIFKIYFGNKDRGFFAKLFRRNKEISEDSKAYAKRLYKELEETSKSLLNEVDKLERRIIAIPEEEFKELA